MAVLPVIATRSITAVAATRARAVPRAGRSAAWLRASPARPAVFEYRLVYAASVVPRLMKLVFWFEWSVRPSFRPPSSPQAPE
jgi:hypothetical protein